MFLCIIRHRHEPQHVLCTDQVLSMVWNSILLKFRPVQDAESKKCRIHHGQIATSGRSKSNRWDLYSWARTGWNDSSVWSPNSAHDHHSNIIQASMHSQMRVKKMPIWVASLWQFSEHFWSNHELQVVITCYLSIFFLILRVFVGV